MGKKAADYSDQPGLAPENLTTSAHFSVSSAISLTKSFGEPRPVGAPILNLPVRTP